MKSWLDPQQMLAIAVARGRITASGYCVKMTTGPIPEDIAEKLAELNK